jgi:hypothetical protein
MYHDTCPRPGRCCPIQCRKAMTVAATIMSQCWLRDIRGALMVSVLAQYLLLHEHLLGFAMQEEMPYRFIWYRTSSGVYSDSLAYGALFLGQTGLHCAKELWKVKPPNNCRFFMWLIHHGWRWTYEQQQRHGLQNHGPCALCSQERESIDHLFL